jgi:signal transduction histidine kinase
LLYRYQVWTSRGALVLRSHEAPDSPMVALTRFGFETVRVAGEDYRTFSAPTRDGMFVVQVAECMTERVGQLGVVTAYYVGFLILPFGLIFGATWLLLRRSLRSVRSIAAQLTSRNPLDATKLDVQDPPQEMLPVLRSLDALFERTGRAISVERRFTSVAAHEMRTPLAGLRAHAQLAVSASNAEESRDALDAVIQGVDRASHLLSQLIDIARIEGMPKDSALFFKEVDIAAACTDALRDIRPLALKKGVSIVSELRLASFQAHPTSLFLIIRNLVANAVLYCPEGGSVRVSVALEEGLPVLLVDDSGPGIAAEDRERAFERFNRLGHQDVEGVGLGLSIVLMAVELHRAKIALLDSPLGGLRCRIVFGATKPLREGYEVQLASA